MTHRWSVALASASILALSACSSTGGAGGPNGSDGDGATANGDAAAGATTADQLRMGITSAEGNLTPFTYETGTPGLSLTMLTYDSLLQIDSTGTPQPWLASSVERSDDGLTYELAIDETATWHDGEDIDAEDVVFSINYYLEGPPGRFQNALGTVAEATAVDENTVKLTLTQPNPSFDLRVLADVPVLPEHVWSEVDDPDTAPFDETTSVGSGPYRLVDSQPGTSYTLEANPDYFRGTPTVDKIVVVRFADDAGAIAALRAGEVDTLMRTISPEHVDSLESQGLEILQVPEYSSTLLAYDTQREPFSDVEVRRAINLAVDVQRLVDDVYLGAAVPGNAGWVHPNSPWHNPEVTTTTDPEEAAQVLEAAGYTDTDGDGVRENDGEPVQVELLVYGNNALRLRLGELVAENLGNVGIGVKVSALEMQSVDDLVWPGYDVTQGRDYDMVIWGWSAPTQADIGQMGVLTHSDTAVGTLNITGYSDPAADELADAVLGTLDEDERRVASDALQAHIAQAQPFKTLLYPNGVYAFRPEVYAGWVPITGQGPMTKLSFIPEEGQP